jgi:hypothetical protein
MICLKALIPPACRVRGTNVLPWRVNGSGSMRGSPTGGAPTSSSSGIGAAAGGLRAAHGINFSLVTEAADAAVAARR